MAATGTLTNVNDTVSVAALDGLVAFFSGTPTQVGRVVFEALALDGSTWNPVYLAESGSGRPNSYYEPPAAAFTYQWNGLNATIGMSTFRARCVAAFGAVVSVWLAALPSQPDAPAGHALGITPNDGADLATPSRGLYIGVSGDVTLDTVGGETGVLFKSVPIGTLSVRAKRVRLTGTGATNIVSMW